MPLLIACCTRSVMLLMSEAKAVTVTFASTPVPWLVTVPANRRLVTGESGGESAGDSKGDGKREGGDEAVAARGVAAELFDGVTITLTDTPGGRPSAGADAAAPGEACTTATSFCTAATRLVSNHRWTVHAWFRCGSWSCKMQRH